MNLWNKSNDFDNPSSVMSSVDQFDILSSIETFWKTESLRKEQLILYIGSTLTCKAEFYDTLCYLPFQIDQQYFFINTCQFVELESWTHLIGIHSLQHSEH